MRAFAHVELLSLCLSHSHLSMGQELLAHLQVVKAVVLFGIATV